MYQCKQERTFLPPGIRHGTFRRQMGSRIICMLAALDMRYSELRTQMGNITDAVPRLNAEIPHRQRHRPAQILRRNSPARRLYSF